MKHTRNSRSVRILTLAALLALGMAIPESAEARQSQRTQRGRTQSGRVERRAPQQARPRAAKPSARPRQRVEERSRAPQRTPNRGTAQRAPTRTDRGTAQRAPNRGTAQRAPTRTDRGTAQRAPTRTDRGRAQRAPTRTDRGRAQRAPNRTAGATRVARRDGRGSRQFGSVVYGHRSSIRRPGIRTVVRDRTYVVPRWRYRPAVWVWNRPDVIVRWPRIHVHIDWPWLIRYERRWRPRYRYRQVVHVEVYHDGRQDRSNIEVETFYRHSVVAATDDWAEIEIEIDQIDIYDGDRFLGYVDRLPSDLRRIRATVHRNGDIRFDREVFLVGDPRIGFEVISTRHYDGWIQDNYRTEDGYRAGRVDLRRNRVDSIRRSRLWDPYSYTGVVPVSLLPDQQGWLWDYGVEALSAVYDDYDYYYGGVSTAVAPRSASDDPGLVGADQWSFSTRDGADVRLQRESNLERVR